VSDNVGTFIVALIYIAILYVLVNPANGKKPEQMITAVTGMMGGLISAATGGGSITGTSTTGG